MNLSGKIVLITGASRGIGASSALLAAKEGAKVIVNYRKNKSKAADVVKQIEKGGGHALTIQADVSNLSQIKNMVKKIIDKWGKIDVLINNAGVFTSGSILNQTKEKIEETIDVNLKGVIFTSREVIPLMIKQKDGVIVNISSGAGKRGHADYSIYSATKFAVLGFTQSIAQELTRHNIRVYAVCPGKTATDMTQFRGMKPEKVAQKIISAVKEYLGLTSGENAEIYF
ncbi:SDR family oxidoreductase [Patescibacteria group bacterium]|nr:SDR family oxidoreductase [Patescibacteria group bacterium]